jgi:undecaprenyl-diphosphatase
MDAGLYRWINDVAGRTGWAHPIVVGFAKYGIVLFAGLLVVAYVDARRRDDLRGVAGAVWAAAAAIVALGVGQLIGRAVDRARPYQAMSGVHVLVDRTSDFSFPSDHATAVGAVAVGLLLAGRRRWGVVAAIGAIAMAVARVYVGVHYPGDVLVGLALGGVVAAVGGLLVLPPLVRLARWLATTPGRVLVVGSSRAAVAPTVS